MKIRSVIFAVVALSGLLTSTAANAGPDFSGSNVNMGYLSVGDSGTITNIYQGLFSIPPNEVAQSLAYGYIPRNSVINFTYNLTSGILGGGTTATSSYDYMRAGNHYNGSSTNVSGFAPVQQGFINGVAGVSQVFSVANYTQGSGMTATATTQVANYTASSVGNPNGYQYFTSALVALLLQNPQATGYITYTVSSIPLPAAFPMLAVALGGMFGFARKRKFAAA
jgi:hypothetical protein